MKFMTQPFTGRAIISHARAVPPAAIVAHSSLSNPLLKSLDLARCLISFPPRSTAFVNSTIFPLASSNSSSSIKVAEIQETGNLAPLTSNSNWSEFATKVSGEWDGYGADFTADGKPIELPESVVPQAFREWEVQVFDWQTQCPTLASQEEPTLTYRSIKLLPTVGCEADAATVYTSDERVMGGSENRTLASAYHSSGSYMAIWQLYEKDGIRELEVESCLIDPRNRESRVRVIMAIRVKEAEVKLENIRVFCEQWYGPFRNGDQLGGCAIRDSAFASTPPLLVSEVVGTWHSSEAVAQFEDSENTVFQELVDERTSELTRDQHGLITLPRQMWCSLKGGEHGKTCAEVGWILDQGIAISSRCVFSKDGNLKEMAIGNDTAASRV